MNGRDGLYETILGQTVKMDYDGNLIEIGETMEHVAYRLHREGCSPEEISRINYLASDVVQGAIKKYSV